MLTISRLKELLDYNQVTGLFVWRKQKGRGRVGKIAGVVGKQQGYVSIRIDGKLYQGHRLAWFYVYGMWPDDDLDHIDLNRANNAISNLRVADHRKNQGNTGARCNNELGIKGVSRSGNKYRARLNSVHIGLFLTAEEANEAYMKAAKAYYGEFARG